MQHTLHLADKHPPANAFHVRYPVVRLDLDTWGGRVCSKLRGLVAAARPFLQRQPSPDHFAHLGCDFIVDEDGEPWLLEVNAPPCLASQSGSAVDDDAVGALLDPQLDAILASFVLPYVAQDDASLLKWTPAVATGCDRRIWRKHRSTDSPACPERCLEPLGGLEADDNHDAAVCCGSRGAGNASTNVWHRVMDADPQFRPSSESGLAQNTVLWDTYADTHACS